MRSFINKPIVGIAFALLIKLMMIGYVVSQSKGEKEYSAKFISPVVLKTSDYSYFIVPVENYFKDNAGVVYYTKPSEPFAGRMPGYWFPYFLLRLVFSSYTAINALILIQVFLSALAVYYLAKSALNMFQSTKAFYFVYFLFLFTPYILSFDLSTQSESFAVSASIFHIYFLSNYFYRGKRRSDLVLSGLFLAWVIFLRPFTGLAIGFIPMIFFIYSIRKKENLKVAFTTVFLFCLPFVILEAAWITRNYIQLKKIIPLETSLEESYGKLYAKPWVQIRQMIVAMGEDAAYFEPGTMSAWFKQKPDSTLTDNYTFRKNLFTNVPFTRDSIVLLKQKYHEYMEETDPQKEKTLCDYCVNTAKRYQSEYTASNIFKVYAKFPVHRFRKFIFNSGSSYLPLPPFSKMAWHQKAFKIFASLMYYITVILGFLGMLILLFRRKFDQMGVILLTHIAVIVALVVIFIDIQENRYLMTVFPAFVLFACVPLTWFLNRKEKFNAAKNG